MGKTGKPQKSKKHKKLKTTFDTDDPLRSVQQKKRERNLRPVNEDEQEIPKKVKDIMRFQSNVKKNKLHKGNKNGTFKMVRGMSVPLKAAPVFVKQKHETDRDFMRRVDIETHRVLTKAHIEEKYKVEIEEDGETKETKIKKKKSEKKRQKDRERKQKKKEGKIMKKLDRKEDFSDLRDKVEFGETVMQPPSLTAKPRKAQKDDTTAKPGKRPLLLKQMMEEGRSPVQKTNSLKVIALANRQAGETVKRKFLSPAQQQISDFQRHRAIELYRRMKQKKVQQS